MAEIIEPAGEADLISVIYDGELATTGQLHFYEYGRAVYAFARLVSTIENFRRTGRVAKKVSEKSYVNIIIRAPERGSFPIDIIIPIAGMIVQHLPAIPPSVLFKYVMHLVTRLLPKEETIIIELAKIEERREKTREKSRVQISQEETKRTAEIRQMIESQNVTMQLGLHVVQKALDAQDDRISEVGSDRAELNRLAAKLRAEAVRENDFVEYQDELESLDQASLARLTSRVRPQIAEVGLPLRRSASRMQLTSGRTRRVFADLDKANVEDINSRSLDEEESTTELQIKAYDRDTGIGRCDLIQHNLQRISFSVPVDIRTRLRRRILRAMNEDVVRARIRLFRDKSGRITSLVIYELFVEE